MEYNGYVATIFAIFIVAVVAPEAFLIGAIVIGLILLKNFGVFDKR